MKVIAYVSDEQYVAIPGVAVEIESLDDGKIVLLTSSPRGALYADLKPGQYRVALAKDGFGSKWEECELANGRPRQFRLLHDGVVGYMWPKWVRSGEKSEIRVHSTEQYQLSLWRYGLEIESFGTLSWFDEHGPRAVMQLAPDGDFSQTGMNWNARGYPSPHPQQFVVGSERSGLYYLWARTLSGRTFSFPWVVAPRTPKSKIAVLASTNTWNAYNNYGGRSNYVNPTGLPPTPTVNARLDLDRYVQPEPVWRFPDNQYLPLSFDRPEPDNHILGNSPWDGRRISDPIYGRGQCGLAPGEWRLLGWLEREGFEYDYYAEAQLHDGTFPLDHYKVLIISVHPEYWTGVMYDRVKDWVERGGRLMYLGGNGVNCEVELMGNSITCRTHDTTAAQTHESRMHRTHRPEASLLGVVFTHTGVMTGAPYRVIEEDHWIFEKTGLRKNDTFGQVTLHERVPGGASGHETDKLSTTSPSGWRPLAKGMNPNDGGAEIVTGELGMGQVFAVGSITWVAALFPDARVSQITRNVLSRFQC